MNRGVVFFLRGEVRAQTGEKHWFFVRKLEELLGCEAWFLLGPPAIDAARLAEIRFLKIVNPCRVRSGPLW
jgi:hypothetical protein